MRVHLVGLVFLLASGCSGADGSECLDGGCESSDYYETQETIDTGTYEGPTVFLGMHARCQTEDGMLVYLADIKGQHNGVVRVDAMDTQSPSFRWNEGHELTMQYGAPAGSRLEVWLEYGAHQQDWQPGVSTHFNCSDHIDAGVMTYVYRVYDATGALADCRYEGHDGAGMVAGNYEFTNEVASPEELMSCLAR